MGHLLHLLLLGNYPGTILNVADFITSVISHDSCESADVSLSEQHGVLYGWGSASN